MHRMRELLYQERSVDHLDFSPMKGVLVTPAAVLSKGCKLLKGTLETLRAPPHVSSRSGVKVVDVKNSNCFYSCPLEVTLRSSYPLEVVLRPIPCCCSLALRQQ